MVFLSIIRTIRPEIYIKIKQGNIEYEGENGLLIEANLNGLNDNNLPSEYSEDHYLKWIIRYDLSSTDEAREMLKNLLTMRDLIVPV